MTILGLLLLIVVLAVLFPRTGAYNANWGYAPFSVGGILLIIFVIWLLFGGSVHIR